jgi:hypothetical protein
MSKINDYTILTTPALDDKLIGTRTGGSPENATFNFTPALLLALFQANFNAATIVISNVPVYADNAAAVAAGLAIGKLYRTGDALKIVHT